MYKTSTKPATNRVKFFVIMLCFIVIASFSAMSSPIQTKAFADENIAPTEEYIDPSELYDDSNEVNTDSLSTIDEDVFSQEAITAIDHDANFSPVTLQFLKTNTGLNGEQWNNIMKLINKPEQDSLDWTKYYGYAEDIDDDRGYTIGIFGATTGGSNDTGPDGPALFKEFDAASGASNPSIQGGLTRAGIKGTMNGKILKITDSNSVFVKKINALQNNAVWREAMWRTFYNVYIKYSVQQAKNRGFNSALTIGSFVDAALNHGASGDSNSLEGILSRSGNSTNEKTFMTNFYAKRTLIVDTNEYNQPPNGKNRVKQWSSLLNSGETDLKNADAAVVKATKWTMQ
ncbi:chitosanase [Paenibacillus sp. IHBB 10380]|uniref:chitosanase n=1 Tax=Paenibacillus sp. IHBB 10380 TaxID=1566358 RepID=UPI0005D85B13|nr:chitosanase [Paenibacillus sp. IHBB 10380]AJS58858.1 chemotaxis protein [Paenibacillus sp. IHBB 10380]